MGIFPFYYEDRRWDYSSDLPESERKMQNARQEVQRLLDPILAKV